LTSIAPTPTGGGRCPCGVWLGISMVVDGGVSRTQQCSNAVGAENLFILQILRRLLRGATPSIRSCSPTAAAAGCRARTLGGSAARGRHQLGGAGHPATQSPAGRVVFARGERNGRFVVLQTVPSGQHRDTGVDAGAQRCCTVVVTAVAVVVVVVVVDDEFRQDSILDVESSR